MNVNIYVTKTHRIKIIFVAHIGLDVSYNVCNEFSLLQTVSGNINMKSRHQFRRRFSLQPAFLKEEEEEPQKNVPK